MTYTARHHWQTGTMIRREDDQGIYEIVSLNYVGDIILKGGHDGNAVVDVRLLDTLVDEGRVTILSADTPADPAGVPVPAGTTFEHTGSGVLGEIGGHLIVIESNHVRIIDAADKARDLTYRVPNYGTNILDLMRRPGARIGYGVFPDDARCVYLYDRDDEMFGYACNMDFLDGSEWGYAPFDPAED